MSSAEFADLARIHPEAFTRQRALSLPHRVSMRLKLRKGSIGDELDRFFGVLHDQPLADGVSPSAFCHARMQLDPRALLALSRPLLEGFERDFTPRLWHGLRLLAIDGSTARLPNTDDAMATFGVPPEEGSSVPLARFFGERVLAGEHLAARNNVASVPGCCWLYSREVSAFVASGKNSEAVLFTPGPHARQHCQTYGLATDPIPLRLIRVKLNKRRT